MAVTNLGTGGGGFQVSPGINISEIDLTTVVPATSTTEGAIAGVFRWGPVGKYILIDSENALVARYGKPKGDLNPETWFTAANFLSYGNKLYVSRADSATQFAAVANSGTYTAGSQDVDNADLYDGVTFDTDVHFVAKYPGALGNSLRITTCTNANQYNSTVALANSTIPGTFSVLIGGTTGTLSFGNTQTADATDNTAAYSVYDALSVGDFVLVGNSTIGTQYLKIKTKSAPAITPTNSVANFTVVGNTDIGANTLVISGNTFTGLNLKVGDTLSNSANVDAVNTAISATIATQINSTAFTVSTASAYVVANGTTTITATGANRANTATFNLTFTDNYKLGTDYSTNSLSRYWEAFNQVDAAPGQSDWVATYNSNTSAKDEMHVVVIDEDGEISGNPGTVLEVFQGLSRATDAKKAGSYTANYYKTVINDFSQYIWAASDLPSAQSNTAANISAVSNNTVAAYSMAGGTDAESESNIALQNVLTAYDLFADKDTVDISLVLTGKSRGGTQGEQVFNYLLDNIAGNRKDCVVFGSPQQNDVVGIAAQSALQNVKDFAFQLRNTSFGVLDSGYKYQYDKYSDVYRWIPLNGDVAGLCVRTDNENDPWFSPAGFNRGQIKNIIKLAYNPSKADRDELYKNRINPVVTFPGQGTVLFGDKTLLSKPSAFDRINVRRLFIVLEKAIANAAKSSLFEFNDEFTRASFVNLVEPFLRDVQGRRGIYDFRVVCDETNNTPEVVDSQRFVGDIYIKPAKAINYIQLNFVAVRSGVEFSEIAGQF